MPIAKHLFLHIFLFANFRVCFNTKLYKNIPNVDFMTILMKWATCHLRNAFKRLLRPNAPTVRVLTSVILKGIRWAFRKLYPTKIPGMVHQGLLAPERLINRFLKQLKWKWLCLLHDAGILSMSHMHTRRLAIPQPCRLSA